MAGREHSGAAAGMAMALGAFACWGLLPLYWKALGDFGAYGVVGHRVLWSLPVLVLLVCLARGGNPLARVCGDGREWLRHLVSGILLGANWFLFILATLTGRVLEAALGYFLNPLFSVALGWWLLGEKRDGWQSAAVLLAAAGVLIQTLAIGSVPWLALGLASTFALYGLARKRSPLGALDGLMVETILMSPAAIALLFLAPGPAWPAVPLQQWLLAGSGLATTIPLLLFVGGARRIPLATLGMLQYLAPTLQFLIGALVFHEALNPLRLASFCFIWLGVGVFLAAGRRAAAAGRGGNRTTEKPHAG